MAEVASKKQESNTSMRSDYQRAVQQYGQKVYAFACYSLRGRQGADDVTQEVLIKLWRNWGSIDPDKIMAWLMRVTRNAVIDQVRKQQLADSRVDDRIDPDASASSEDHDDALDRDRLRQVLLESIQALDEPFRSLLIMRDIQGMAYADIEVVLRLSESQVKVYLHRGRRKLRENENLRQLFHAVRGTGEGLSGATGSASASRQANGAGPGTLACAAP